MNRSDRTAPPPARRTRGAEARPRVYRYRFYPDEEQAAQLTRTFGACRWVYNQGLVLRTTAWRDHGVRVGFAETCRALTGWRHAAQTSWLRDISSAVLQQSLRHLDAAFSRFFKRTSTHPEPKRKNRSRDSATYVRTGFRWRENPARPGTGLISLAKQSEPLDVRWSRPLPPGAAPVKLTVTRDRAGRFFLQILVEEHIAPLPPALAPDHTTPQAVGLDLGLAALATLDDGTTAGHPRLLRTYGAKLARLQRELHRKERGSANRGKARARLARLHAAIADYRRDALDQLTTRLVRENQVLVVEDLAVANLVRSPSGPGRRRKAGLNRSIADAAWSTLLRMLRYKCAWYGRTLVIVDRFFPSTRRCSACHAHGERLDVSVRSWTCTACGAAHDRDVNAARNLRQEGLRLYEQAVAALSPGRQLPAVVRASAPAGVVVAA
ncbi:hypothetical protein SUDANB120_02828 [Streptomyces sp. enrichment culture]|uniref:RNA-guided endonuclease InsQ/TnpB family protein n=1 Tax=Streptomyces sp. enrichment culture TaxID=1795815 RepID=UPI003F54B4A6